MDYSILTGGSAKHTRSETVLSERKLINKDIADNVSKFDRSKTPEFKAAMVLIYWAAGGQNRIEAITIINKLKEHVDFYKETLNIINSYSKWVDQEDLVKLVDRAAAFEGINEIIYLCSLLYSVYGDYELKTLEFTDNQIKRITNGNNKSNKRAPF